MRAVVGCMYMPWLRAGFILACELMVCINDDLRLDSRDFNGL